MSYQLLCATLILICLVKVNSGHVIRDLTDQEIFQEQLQKSLAPVKIRIEKLEEYFQSYKNETERYEGADRITARAFIKYLEASLSDINNHYNDLEKESIQTHILPNMDDNQIELISLSLLLKNLKMFLEELKAIVEEKEILDDNVKEVLFSIAEAITKQMNLYFNAIKSDILKHRREWKILDPIMHMILMPIHVASIDDPSAIQVYYSLQWQLRDVGNELERKLRQFCGTLKNHEYTT